MTISELVVLEAGIRAVRGLMNESEGVIGLHLNGNIATWEELQEGGTYEEWLIDFNKAEDLVKRGITSCEQSQ